MRRARGLLGTLVAGAVLSSCVAPAAPEPAQLREVPPPWSAPRDAISYIDAAGLPHVRLDATDHQHLLTLRLQVAGAVVPVAALVGIDRVRAVQAPVHTHDESGQVWLEGEGTDQVTLGSFFILWGVRFQADGDRGCLGSVCGPLTVTADGTPVADPVALRLATVRDTVTITVG